MCGLLLGLGPIPTSSGPPEAPAPTVAFVDVHVLPMDGQNVLENQTVLVEDERIVRIGPVSRVRVPTGARVIDTPPERWLMPGLTDAHVHLRSRAESWLDLFLANGITTIFNLRGDSVDLAAKRAVETGERAGPTIYTAGPYLDELGIRSPAEADSVLRVHHGAGYDLAKIHGQVPADVFRGIVEAAHRHGMPVIGHVPRNLPLDSAIATGMDLVSHAEELVYSGFPDLERGRLRETARRMTESDMWLTPTLAGFSDLTRQWGAPDAVGEAMERPETRYLNREIRSFWTEGNPYVHRTARPADAARLARQRRFQEHMVAVLHEEGVPLLAGTDAPFPTMVPGFSLHRELLALRSAGLEAEDVLRAATSNAGEFIASRARPEDRFGQVKEGYRADLLLLSTDPRRNLSVLGRPVGVMVRGRWLPRAELDRRLHAVAEESDGRTEDRGPLPSDGELRRFTGRFVSEAPAFDVRVRTFGDGELIVEDARSPGEGPRYRLVPMGSRRFRVLGGPFELFAEFSESGATMTLRTTPEGGDVFARLSRRDPSER